MTPARISPQEECPHCGYALAGLPVGEPPHVVCPECGRRVTLVRKAPVRHVNALIYFFPLWPWVVLWAGHWVALFLGAMPERLAWLVLWGMWLAIVLSTLTAIAGVSRPRFRAVVPASTTIFTWLLGNVLFGVLARLWAELLGSAGV